MKGCVQLFLEIDARCHHPRTLFEKLVSFLFEKFHQNTLNGLFQNGTKKRKRKKNSKDATTLKMDGLHEKSIWCELSDRSQPKILNQKFIFNSLFLKTPVWVRAI